MLAVEITAFCVSENQCQCLPSFSQDKTITDLAILTNGHTCRTTPTEAIIYSLRATGEIWEGFSSVFSAKLTSETDDATISVESPSLQIPVDFTRDDVIVV